MDARDDQFHGTNTNVAYVPAAPLCLQLRSSLVVPETIPSYGLSYFALVLILFCNSFDSYSSQTAIPFLITSFVVADATKWGHFACSIVPGYAAYRGFGVIEGEASGGQPYRTWQHMFDPNRNLFWVFVSMVCDTVIFFSAIMAIEMSQARCGRCRDAMRLRSAVRKGADSAVGGGGSNQAGSAAVGGGDGESDPLVDAEVRRSETMMGAVGGRPDLKGENLGMLLANVSKTFVMGDGRLNLAVQDVCLGVEKGTVFGLLGMNGAGKTTLFHTMQGKHQATTGDCLVDGGGGAALSCRDDVDKVRQMFGICPQHEVLWEFCTPREHLRAFAHIRGVPTAEIERTVSDLIKRLDLSNKSDANATNLSGGQKRRLAIALAVIGSPRVVFLDEPTTGLDPNTRRFVWDYILELKKERIVLLTTHSMEEADALCTRIGIMVNGQLRSLGTPQQLKKRYGAGYRVMVRRRSKGGGEGGEHGESKSTGSGSSAAAASASKLDVAALAQPLREVLEGSYGAEAVKFEETASSSAVQAYAIASDDLKLGSLFALLEDHRERLDILDYSVSQTTLEQVFQKFAKYQHS